MGWSLHLTLLFQRSTCSSFDLSLCSLYITKQALFSALTLTLRVGSNSRLANLPKPVKAYYLSHKTMPDLEHIYLKALCQPSNPVLGGSLILLITSSSEVLNFLEIKQPLVPVFWIFLETQHSECLFLGGGRIFATWRPKKKRAGESNKGILETFKNKFAISWPKKKNLEVARFWQCVPVSRQN
jgi:hypothetical protein